MESWKEHVKNIEATSQDNSQKVIAWEEMDNDPKHNVRLVTKLASMFWSGHHKG